MGVVSAIIITSIALTVTGKVTRSEELEYAGLATGVVGGGAGAIMGETTAAALGGVALAAGNSLAIAGKATGDENLSNAGLAVGLVGAGVSITNSAVASGIFDPATINTGVEGAEFIPGPVASPAADALAAPSVAGELSQGTITGGAGGDVLQGGEAVANQRAATDKTWALDYSGGGDVSFDATAPPAAPTPTTAPGQEVNNMVNVRPMTGQPPLLQSSLLSTPTTDARGAWDLLAKGSPSESLWDKLDKLPDWGKLAIATTGIGAVGSMFGSIPANMSASDRLTFDRWVQQQRQDIATKELAQKQQALDIRTKATSGAPLVTFNSPNRPAGLMRSVRL